MDRGIHWRTIRDNYVFLKDNLITHTTLIDELLACDVFSDEDKADYKKSEQHQMWKVN